MSLLLFSSLSSSFQDIVPYIPLGYTLAVSLRPCRCNAKLSNSKLVQELAVTAIPLIQYLAKFMYWCVPVAMATGATCMVAPLEGVTNALVIHTPW